MFNLHSLLNVLISVIFVYSCLLYLMHDLSSNLLVKQVVSTVVVSSVSKSKLVRSKSDLNSNFFIC